MGWSWGRPRAVYFSPLQIIAFLVFILLFLLSYYVLLPSEFARPIPTLFAFCYMIALFALSVFLAWSVVKVYRHIQKHSKQKQEQWDLVGWSKVSRQTQTNFCLSNFLQEAKPVFSVFFSGLSLAVISYAVLNQQLSFLFLTRVHQP